MKTITIKVVLSEEVLEGAQTFAQMIDVTPQEFLSYLAEGWTSPRSNLRKRLASTPKVELPSPRKNGLCTKNTALKIKRVKTERNPNGNKQKRDTKCALQCFDAER